ncbi:hypothetical protein [Chitinophaga sp. sic0106]|uniref:hypothetical protein n=1 Tax=Chitinophaga sp. sic0106 TaxID=2854785 RepID=UPI001C46B30A|nr:hypothetical protein [Chitinophaga sp. sic0106]MBV7531510.1 hypothetical protein [Chitinophaga sp. sic0106]
MSNNNLTRKAANALLLAVLGLSSAFTVPGEPQPTYLTSISSSGGRTTVEYNADKSISRLVQVHKGESGDYNEVIKPVYDNGRLVKTMASDGTSADEVNTSLDYNPQGQVTRISYYRNEVVYAYDSLVYNEAGQLTTRHQFTAQPSKGNFDNSGYQEFTWDAAGDIIRQDNYGKQPGFSKFLRLSSISYRYDNKVNSRQQHPGLRWILELQPANLSAHNVVSETLTSSRSSRAVTSTCTYSYSGGKFPLKATYSSDADREIVKMEFTRL